MSEKNLDSPQDATDRPTRRLLPGKTLAALILALLAVFAIAGMSLESLAARSVMALRVSRTHELRHHVSTVSGYLSDAESGKRGFLLTGTETHLEPYDEARTSLPAEISAVRRLTADNPMQQRSVDRLQPKVTAALTQFASTIALRRAGSIDAALAAERTGRGKLLMDSIRVELSAIDEEEARLLESRTADWQRSATMSTIVVTGGSVLLFLALMLIAAFASTDFRAREAESWQRNVQVAVNAAMEGDQRLESLGAKLIDTLARSVDAPVGAFYVTEPNSRLRRVAGRALDAKNDASVELSLGEGLLGQAAKERRIAHLRELPAGYLPVSSALGRAATSELVVVPAWVDDELHGVLEFGFLRPVKPVELEVLARVAEGIAIAIRSARDRSRLEALLEETQRQAEELQAQQEELQAQQEELKVANEELEQHTKSLQLSQTTLQNQQAELEQTNAQLEEQTSALETQRDDLARVGTELQRASTYKSEFLANMSHELRTPLNSALILAKLLADNREGNLTAEQIKFAQTISDAGNDLLVLINDILDLSKIEAGKFDVRPEPVSIARLLDGLSGTFRPVADDKRIELALSIGPDAPEGFETDPTRLQQILKNLLSNALKFTEQGGVSMAVSSSNDRVEFAVRDTGIGIAPDQHELIFEAFRQADGGSSRKFGGTGLGLSISRDLARLLGGELSVESAVGRGSTFTLSLPMRYAGTRVSPRERTEVRYRSAARTDHARPSIVASGAAPPNTAQSSARVLLIIEDDAAFAGLVDELGRELDFHCLVANTAAHGLELARQRRPSAIVLDIGLPDRSGLSVLDALKRDPLTRHVPVHVISAHDHAKAALAMGAIGYALKPIERDKLAAAIKQLDAKFTQQLRRVLIVEDDAVLRESTARLLAAKDVETVGVGTTREALAQLAAGSFDCIVLDLSLPDRSGRDLLEELARSDRASVPPVIVYTGRSLTQDEVHDLEQFSSAIVIKGARSPERLLDEVTLFLHQVESALPPERQRMLRSARDREAAFDGRRILIVEDDVRNVFALTSVLEPLGAKVAVARNGREALDYLSGHAAVDLVLMDLMMPVMDGIEAMRAIRQQPQFAKLPIIALTAKAMIDDREKCLAAGANDYIAKPLDVDKLLSLARVWIRK